MRLFITGGTGFVGGAVLSSLREAGHQLRVLVRPGSETKLAFVDHLDVVVGNVSQPETWIHELREIDAVIHLVGIIREYPTRSITFEQAHVETTSALLDAAIKNGVTRILHMSANGANASGVSTYQTSKWRAEQLVMESGMNWTIFRPSVIFGDARGGMEFTSELAKVIRMAPLMPLFGDGSYRLDPIAVEDVADSFARALYKPESEQKIFHLGGGAPLGFYDIIQQIGKAVGRKRTKTVMIPLPLIRAIARLLGRFPLFPITIDQLNMLVAGNVCPENDYRQLFKIEPKPFTYQNLSWLSGYYA